MHYFFRSDVRSYCMQKQADCGHWPSIIKEIKSLDFQLTSFQLGSVRQTVQLPKGTYIQTVFSLDIPA